MTNRYRALRTVAALIGLIISTPPTFLSAASTRFGRERGPLILERAAAAPVDWSTAMVESTIKRYPTAESLEGWGYAKSLYLYGEYLVYLRTHDKRYLDHVKAWILIRQPITGVARSAGTA